MMAGRHWQKSADFGSVHIASDGFRYAGGEFPGGANETGSTKAARQSEATKCWQVLAPTPTPSPGCTSVPNPISIDDYRGFKVYPARTEAVPGRTNPVVDCV